MKRTVIVSKKRFYSFVVLAIASLSLMLMLGFGFLSDHPVFGASVPTTREIVVRSGDSVWSIAEPIAEQTHRDTRDVVRDIYRFNDLGRATIHPGQPLRVPGH